MERTGARVKRKRVVLGVGVGLAVVGSAITGVLPGIDRAGDQLTGVVVGPAGRPIADATVTVGDRSEEARTDADGRFTLPGGAAWVTATAEGWLPRTRAATPEEELVIRVAPDGPGTVTLAFGGDVMFGRRYYDPQENGSMGGLLAPGASAEAHADLLAGVAPLFADADIAAVNLETPLVTEPYYDPLRPRPVSFHQTKDYAFASSTVVAEALKQSGIDVVGLGNNHLYDALETGVLTTRRSLVEAGFRPVQDFFGAGADPSEAWKPAVTEIDGQEVAFVGCTSILDERAGGPASEAGGDDQPLSYVAERGKGGAAQCAPDRLRRAVTEATAHADIVVAMVHGGYEYGRAPSDQVRALSDVAVAAGATMVINHHPHVVGGVRFAGGQLTAWTLGNLLFDQTMWPTFESYVLQVAVRHGQVVAAWIEPIRLQGYLPVGVYGDDASWVVSGALARSEGPWVADDGSLWLDSERSSNTQSLSAEVSGLAEIQSGCAPGAARELLWTGDFESQDLDPNSEAPLWNADEPDAYRRVDPDAGRDGGNGVLLHRGSANDSDVLLTVNHRVLVQQRNELTLLVDHRALFGDPDAQLQLSWYNDTKGGSQEQTLVTISTDGSWQTLRVDVRVPHNAVAVQPFIRLAPPEDDVSQLAVDNVRLVNWDEPGCDYLRETAALTSSALPPERGTPTLVELSVQATPVDRPQPLPPGPVTLLE